MKTARCDACGIEKDLGQEEVYPFDDEAIDNEFPSPPLIDVECQPINRNRPWKTAKVCHRCLYKLGPDLWINQVIWDTFHPVKSFEDLKDQ